MLDRKTGAGADGSGSLYDHWSADLASTADYYPGGMMMPGRNTEHDWSRIGMQGQAKDDEVYGKGNTYAYKYRMNDARINRFFSPDPLHAKYPYNSDYAFAENRLIDGVELEGLEWSKPTNNQINVNVNQDVTSGTPLVINFDSYNQAISDQLNSSLSLSTNGSLSGSATYNTVDESKVGRVVPHLTYQGYPKKVGDKTVGGSSSANYMSVPLMDKNGLLRSQDEVGLSTLHELLHTLRVDHPFETTQGPELELQNVGENEYKSTPLTDPNIFFNVMMYNFKIIDGKSLKGNRLDRITESQVKLINNEIDLQMGGAGFKNKFSEGSYWDKFPGKPVK